MHYQNLCLAKNIIHCLGLMIVSVCYLCANTLAIETGEIVLQDLPPKAYIYVDGNRVIPQQGKIHLSQGDHEVQVEATENNGIVAFRRKFYIRPDEAVTVPIVLLPVHVASPFHGGPIAKFTVGRTGRPGLQGPDGQTADNSTLSTDDKALQALLKETLRILLTDMEGQIDRLRYYAGADRPQSYWYAPSRSDLLGPLAPPGAMGPTGPRGINGNVLLLQTNHGRLLLNILKEDIGLTPVERTLQQVEHKLRSANREEASAVAFRHWLTPIVIFTPYIKQRLDIIRKDVAHKLATIPILGAWGQTGKSGPPGQRGGDGETAGGAPIYLLPEQVQQLLSAINKDQKLRDRVENLKRDVKNLEGLMLQAEFG